MSSSHQIVDLRCLFAKYVQVPVHSQVLALLLPQSFYLLLLMRLHMGVYRFFLLLLTYSLWP